MQGLEAIRSQLNGRTIDSAVELALDGGSQLTVVVPTEGEPRSALSVAPRPEGLFILGFRGIFRLDSRAEAADVISQIVDRMAAQPEFVFDARDFSLEPYSYQKWLDDGRRRSLIERVEGGWNPLSDAENEELWATFTRRFSFRGSLSRSAGPAITEPPPFVTWSVSEAQALYARDPLRFRDVERRSRELLIQALLDVGIRTGPMYALDFNHEGYSFDPGVVSRRGVGNWPVPLVPIHNDSLFAHRDFSFGIFGNPWEGSLCGFGEVLMEQLLRNPLPCFGDVIRSHEPLHCTGQAAR